MQADIGGSTCLHMRQGLSPTLLSPSLWQSFLAAGLGAGPTPCMVHVSQHCAPTFNTKYAST
eukprot:9353800-Alexandrium_andersonii.AAC.1